MDGKEFYEKTEEFAKKIITLAAEEGLTVRELFMAADTAKGIADFSMLDKQAIEKADCPSQHIVCTCGDKELLEASKKVGKNPFTIYRPNYDSAQGFS